MVLSLLVAVQLPSTALTGRGTYVATVPPVGRLLVSVTLDNGSGTPLPYRGVQVAISQSALHGVRVRLTTNYTGKVEFPVQPGSYGVSVNNDKFLVLTTVPVTLGQLTHLYVNVNRTAYYASFAAADDTTSEGIIEPWNTMTLEVSPYTNPVRSPLFFLGGQVTSVPTGNPTPALGRFGDVVYIQPMNVYAVPVGYGVTDYEARGGSEVPATVVYQVPDSGSVWLTLKPMGPTQIAGADYLLVISYQAASLVTFI
jgi:hypothetical protein